MHFSGTITKRQLHYVALTMRLGGPISAVSMLDAEQYMVTLKSWSTSRKNVAEGMARRYALAEQVSYNVSVCNHIIMLYIN